MILHTLSFWSGLSQFSCLSAVTEMEWPRLYFLSFLRRRARGNWQVEILTGKQKGENSTAAITLRRS